MTYLFGMKKFLTFGLIVGTFSALHAQFRLGTNSVGINVSPAIGKTLDIKGGNGGQIRLNNAGEASTTIEFSNNDVRRGFIESNTITNEFKIVSETTGQSVKIYTLGTERVAVSSDGVVTLPGGIKFGGNTPTAGTIRWTGIAFEGYDGSAWKPLSSSTSSAQDKQSKTMFYLQNDPY